MTLFKSSHPFYNEIPLRGGLGPQQYEFEGTNSVHNMYISRNMPTSRNIRAMYT